MNNITYIMPTRIESGDRLRNIVTSVVYLLKNFPEAKILIKEVDKESIFNNHALSIIKKFSHTENLRHIFEKSDDDLFHKTKILNDLILEADTDVVASHDVDVVYPVVSHQTAYDAIISDNCDVVYPYGCGVYQYQVNYTQDLFEEFLNQNLNINVILPHCRTEASTIGWTQFYNRKKVIEGYMWNEAFLSWGAEDCEFYYRFNALGYRVGRIESPLWHFEHSRTHNSHYNNPKFMQNHNLWQWIREQDEKMLREYYQNQPYVKRRLNDVSI